MGAGADPADSEASRRSVDIPDSVIGFLNGELGDPPGGGRSRSGQGPRGTRGESALTELTTEQEQALADDPRRALNHLLSPGPAKEFEARVEPYGDLSVLGTVEFLHGLAHGEEYEVDIERRASSSGSSRSARPTLGHAHGDVHLGGSSVRSRSVTARSRPTSGREKADLTVPGHVAALRGRRTLTPRRATPSRPEGSSPTEAMKMEATITAPTAGTVSRLAIGAQHRSRAATSSSSSADAAGRIERDGAGTIAPRLALSEDDEPTSAEDGQRSPVRAPRRRGRSRLCSSRSRMVRIEAVGAQVRVASCPR